MWVVVTPDLEHRPNVPRKINRCFHHSNLLGGIRLHRHLQPSTSRFMNK